MEDQTLQCRDCGTEFLFVSGEQAFYLDKGFVDQAGRIVPPTRCVPCRNAHRRTRAERLSVYR